jgi:hypothetical protein
LRFLWCFSFCPLSYQKNLLKKMFWFLFCNKPNKIVILYNVYIFFWGPKNCIEITFKAMFNV